MTKLGMDDEAVRVLAGQLDGQARTLDGLVTQIETAVSRMRACWQGQDSEAFASRWHRVYRPALHQARESISGLAQSARNNAAAQVGVSSAAGNTHAGAPIPHAAPHPPAAATPTSIGAGYVAAFSAAIPRGGILGDGECVAVFTSYNEVYVHAPPVGVGEGHGAREFYQRYDSLPHLSQYYDKIPASGPPQAGDVVVWGAATSNDGYGHIAVCTGSSGGSFTVIEQNSPWHAPVKDATYASTNNVLGYLRPKQPT